MLQDLVRLCQQAMRQMEEHQNEIADEQPWSATGDVMKYYAKPISKLINELSKLPE